MKKIILILLFILTLSLTGCTSKVEEKEFTGAGLTIRLTSEFKEYEHKSWDLYLSTDTSVAFMARRYTKHQIVQNVDLSTLSNEGYMNFCIANNGFEATVYHVERPVDSFDPFCYCYFTDANSKYGYMMIVMSNDNYFYNINLSTTYADFQDSKQMLMEYAVTIKLN